MGKGLIGNSLSFCMQDILSGEVSIDDIDTIYAGTCFNEETIPNLLERYEAYWNDVAENVTQKKIAEKYGVSRIYSIIDDEQYQEANREYLEELASVREKIKEEAEKVFYELYNSGKIVQTRYRVPEGQTEVATFIGYDGKEKGKEEVNSDEDSLMKINDELYITYDFGNFVYTDPSHKWCDSKEKFIASQLSNNNAGEFIKAGMLKKLFPEYETMITQVCDSLIEKRYQSVEYHLISFEQILAEIETLTKKQGTISHTPDEVADMAEKVGLTKSVVDGVSKEMVGSEQAKGDPGRQDNDNNGSHDDHDDA